jgi:sugar lactone lactonase YvrE
LRHCRAAKQASIEGSKVLTSQTPLISEVSPGHAVPGGRLNLTGSGFDPLRAHAFRVYFGEIRAQITRVSEDMISVIVPQTDGLSLVRVELDGKTSEPHPTSIARLVAEDLHPVANPAFDRDGTLFVTFSGSRGQKVPVSVYQISPDETVEPYLTDIANPTGMALGRDGHLYISSRSEGTVYRVGPERDIQLVADELGIATGLAFDPEGILHVGDRQGTIFRIEPNGEPRTFCHLPPSVAAYHLAFDLAGNLFVSGPSLSSVDSIYRVTPDAKVEVFFTGLGRPQGMAFDTEGNLYVAEALAGDSGVYCFSSGGSPRCIVSSPPLVGLAFDGNGGVILAGSSAVFHLDIGIRGQPLI